MIPGAAVLARLVAIDARRPASWLVGAAAALVVGIACAAAPAAAAGCGALLAVAAVAGLGRGGRDADPAGMRRPARLAWPLAGAVAGGGAAWLSGVAASAAIRTVVVAGTSAATVAALSAVAGEFGWLGVRGATPADADPPDLPGRMGRSWGDAVAMATALAAMAVCYFLAPQWARWYTVLATAWFTLLAVPSATLAGGDERLRRDLLASAAGRPALPGDAAAAGAAIRSYAALLGWPALVALPLWNGPRWAADGPCGALVALASLAAVASMAVRVADRRRWPGETPVVVVAVAHALALAAAAAAATA